MENKIIEIFLQSELKIVSVEKLKLYIDFCINRNTDKSENTEDHHILPKNNNCFPEYKSLKKYPWNKSTLKYEDHYIAHSLLCDAIDDNSVYFAWNAMNSINTNTRNVSVIGEKAYRRNREKHKQAVTNYNKNRIITNSHRNKMSKIMKEKLKGETFYDTTGLMVVRLKGEKDYIQIEKSKYDKKIHERTTSGKITAKDWDGNTFQINKDDTRYLSGEIGGVTANRCIFISPEGIEYKTMNIDKLIKELNLAPTIKNYKNKGIISYEPTPSNKSRYSKFVDINGWELKVLDKPIIKGKYKNAR